MNKDAKRRRITRELLAGQKLMPICWQDEQFICLGQTLIDRAVKMRLPMLFAIFTGLNSTVLIKPLVSNRHVSRVTKLLELQDKWLDWEKRRQARYKKLWPSASIGSPPNPLLEL